MPFATNIFINCPFEDSYKPILKSMVFTVILCGFDPKISENNDSSAIRLQNIQELIEQSKFSIHDVSRMTASKKGEIARFNMPFELGLDLGCKRYRGGEHANKIYLILDEKPHRYKIALSDISGCDIASHSNSPEKAAASVRHFLQKNRQDDEPLLLTGSRIWDLYNEFTGNFEILVPNKVDIDNMPWNEYYHYIKDFLVGKGLI